MRSPLKIVSLISLCLLSNLCSCWKDPDIMPFCSETKPKKGIGDEKSKFQNRKDTCKIINPNFELCCLNISCANKGLCSIETNHFELVCLFFACLTLVTGFVGYGSYLFFKKKVNSRFEETLLDDSAISEDLRAPFNYWERLVANCDKLSQEETDSFILILPPRIKSVKSCL